MGLFNLIKAHKCSIYRDRYIYANIITVHWYLVLYLVRFTTIVQMTYVTFLHDCLVVHPSPFNGLLE